MSEEYGSDFISITDEDGNEYELELLDTMELDGVVYMALLSADSEVPDADDEDGLIILKVIEENGEELLSSLDDDDELDMIYNKFMERMVEEEEA